MSLANESRFFLMIMLLLLSYTDIREYRIPNVIVYPAIAFSLLATQLYVPAIAATILMACVLRDDINKNWGILRWGGGDFKLFILIASLIGWWFIPALFLTEIFIRGYRFMTNYRLGLPVTPFAALSVFTIISIAATLRAIVA